MSDTTTDPRTVGPGIDDIARRAHIDVTSEARQQMIDIMTVIGLDREQVGALDALMQFRHALDDAYVEGLCEGWNDPSLAAKEICDLAQQIADSERPIVEILEIGARCLVLTEHFIRLMAAAVRAGTIDEEYAEKASFRLVETFPAGFMSGC